MTKAIDILNTIQSTSEGLSLSEVLSHHPDVTRRTAQRWIKQLIDRQQIIATGAGRSRRFHSLGQSVNRYDNQQRLHLSHFTLSADSQDILNYIDQAIEARTPVGYQRDFLTSYQPNKTWYLSEPLRRQLQKMGNTQQTQEAERPAGTYGRAILNRLLIDLSWASSHLEGNTYSLLDTRELIEKGQTAQGKAAIETQMILNHKSAIELLLDNVDAVDFNPFTIMNLHSALSENLLPNPADEGRIRQHVVEISQSVFRPLSVPSQINDHFDLMLEKVSQIRDPFEQSFFIMVHLPYLQPFVDINKRTSRLAANLPLFKANLCPLTFLGVPEKIYSQAILGVYEMTRVELLRDLYVWAYERSTQEYLTIRQDLNEPDPLRLKYRAVIKQTIRKVVLQCNEDALSVIQHELEEQDRLFKQRSDKENIEALIIEELRRLHEGVIARYGLRPSEFKQWKQKSENSG